MFSLFRKACLLYKMSKIVYWRFIFTMYNMGIQQVTRGYRGLQEVTGGYKGLQRVTGGYKGLQGVTGGYKGLQGVTKNYRNFLLTRTFPDTFLGLFCMKIKVEKISNFSPKRWTNPFGKIPILRFS